MNDLKRLEGKTIESIDNNSDGKNSYLIIKFKEGGKLNLTSYPNSDEGVGQLDIDLRGVKEADLIGKRILSIIEEFDGANDFIIINFKDGGKLTVTSFSSSEDSTAGLSATVYSAEKLVKESLDENAFNKRYRRNFLKGKKPKKKDYYQDYPYSGIKFDQIAYDLDMEDYIEKNKESLDENSYKNARKGQYPMYQPQYESGEEEMDDQDHEDSIEAEDIVLELEDWLAQHQIYDEQEELEEIQSWIEINLDEISPNVKRKVMTLISQSYDIDPYFLDK